MLTPILFDIAAIIGLCPTGEVLFPTEADKNVIPFKKDLASFTKYMEHFHAKDVDIVSDKEQITFLALCLSKYVFYSQSLKVAK